MSKNITVNQIDKVLDEALSAYKLGKNNAKTLFLSEMTELEEAQG